MPKHLPRPHQLPDKAGYSGKPIWNLAFYKTFKCVVCKKIDGTKFKNTLKTVLPLFKQRPIEHRAVQTKYPYGTERKALTLVRGFWWSQTKNRRRAQSEEAGRTTVKSVGRFS